MFCAIQQEAKLDQKMNFSSPWWIHLPPGTSAELTVRSSMKTLMEHCRLPHLDKGPLPSMLFIAFVANTPNTRSRL